MDDVLRQLDEGWYREVSARWGAPPLSRVWKVAQGVRARLLGQRLSDPDLLDLVVDALRSCGARFDQARPPRSGVSTMTTGDRFLAFFGRKLTWMLKDLRRRLRRKLEVEGPLGEAEHPQPRKQGELLEAVWRALNTLTEQERALLDLRCWQNLSFEALASTLGFRDRYRASEAEARVYAKLRQAILAEMSLGLAA